MVQLRYVIGISAILALTSFVASKADDEANAIKYRDLIKQLVSPNTAPERGGGKEEPWVKFPKGYDLAAQRQIDETRKELQDNIEEALPYLVESLDDDRYCMTINWADGDAYYNKTVGETCRQIIASHLEVYRRKIRFSFIPGQWRYYDYKPISKEWWAERKDRSLVDLQIEAIDWAIERRMAETKIGNLGLDRLNEVAALTKLRDELKDSKTPAEPMGLSRTQTRDVPAR